MIDWQPIETAPLGQWGLVWHRSWRRPFPGMRNGDGEQVWVDTCEPDARGWQAFASHWAPLPTPEDQETAMAQAIRAIGGKR